jgi:hypothetical protein
MLAALTAPALAALPPEYQRERELTAVVGAVAGTGVVVDAVAYLGDDVYRVTFGACTIDVTIVTDPPPSGEPMAGPRLFHVELGDEVCGAD